MVLLPFSASLPWGSGPGISCNTLPPCLGQWSVVRLVVRRRMVVLLCCVVVCFVLCRVALGGVVLCRVV